QSEDRRCTTSNVHTYRLLIVKELYSVLLICYSRAIDKALCLSAAKKEEYEAFHYIRQLLLLLLIAVSGDPQLPNLTASHWGGEL
ncbi:hypothetical protein, partial [Janthinobacterium sp. FW305-129]|uniref:hypothetical protein n=1 Tax=Janthinobacterium sp. FW305-129 TaxID=2775054 RepID=UPI001E3C0B27